MPRPWGELRPTLVSSVVPLNVLLYYSSNFFNEFLEESRPASVHRTPWCSPTIAVPKLTKSWSFFPMFFCIYSIYSCIFIYSYVCVFLQIFCCWRKAEALQGADWVADSAKSAYDTVVETASEVAVLLCFETFLVEF